MIVTTTFMQRSYD